MPIRKHIAVVLALALLGHLWASSAEHTPQPGRQRQAWAAPSGSEALTTARPRGTESKQFQHQAALSAVMVDAPRWSDSEAAHLDTTIGVASTPVPLRPARAPPV